MATWKAASPVRAANGLRSSRPAAFVRRFNQSTAAAVEPSASFPRRGLGLLIGSLVALTVVALAVRIPLFGTADAAPDTSRYLEVARENFNGGFTDDLLLLLGQPRRRLAAFAFLLVLLVAVAAGSLTAVFSQRYDVLLAPFVWMVLAATGALLVELVVALIPVPAWAVGVPARSGRAIRSLGVRVRSAAVVGLGSGARGRVARLGSRVSGRALGPGWRG